MSKCFTKDHCHSTSSLRAIRGCRNHNLLVALHTRIYVKCFRNMDITNEKGFREGIGLLREKWEETDREPSP